MKQEDILLKLNALYDTDVLEHFPKEYLYLYNTPIDKIEEEGKDIIVFGSISDIKSIRTPLSIIRFKINYMNKVLSCAIFNQPFYINVLKKFNKYCLVCRYKKKTKSYIVRYVIKEDSPYLRTKIKPIYTLPKGVSQPDFINLIERILIQKSQYITNKLPKKICDKYKFEDRYLAFKDVHFPLNEDALKRGLRVFKYEEALQYSLATSVIKKYRNLIKKQVTTLIDINEVDTFINKLTFKLTGDQLNAIHEIVFDMNKTQIMNRLLQGDVGTGKTLVALCALYANYLRHGQGALLAPTKILAQQHYENAYKLFKDTPIKIKFLAGNLKTKEKDKINKLLESGEIDIIIGTHTLMSQNIKYKNLTLSIIDEQQNFGVEQRNALINKGMNADLLMMTATPIPRTLSKIINNDMDVSSLNEFPSKKRNVKTMVVQSVDKIINKAILRALEIKRQVFIVSPKIIETGTGKKISVETIFAQMATEYGEDNVALLHGKMKEEERNKIYDEFKSGEKLILVATSIIEVGIDIPHACLMVIYSASTFGLSSLHQLRGRIGRDGESALALLVYDDDDQENYERLKYLADNEDGYNIAKYDLIHRGSGSLTGSNQSGDSDLKVANFANDQVIFEYAIKDSVEILENLDDVDYRIYYSNVLKNLSDYKLD